MNGVSVSLNLKLIDGGWCTGVTDSGYVHGTGAWYEGASKEGSVVLASFTQNNGGEVERGVV